jgi:hypothetical protein
MPKYRATVHVSGLTGEGPRAVRAALDARLREHGLENCRIVAIDIDAPPQNSAMTMRPGPIQPARRGQAGAGGFLLVAAAVWAIWFFWWVLTAAPE